MFLTKLEQLQTGKDNPYYAPGMFPSQRVHPSLPYRREDSNIFYPALIDFTLTPLLGLMETDERSRAQVLLGKIRENYPAYRSLRRPELYNFYRTNPPDPYPNGYLLRRFSHFRLAEDADDTVMISTQLDLPKATIRFVREELVRFSNLEGKRVDHPLTEYGKIPAYGVWFGSGAMPVEIDLCVLCNILFFTARKGQSFNPTDLASFAFIRRAVLSEDLFRHPFVLSHYYPDPRLILYHIARLWSGLPDPGTYLPGKEIIAALYRCYMAERKLLPRMMLASALLKMGEDVPAEAFDELAFQNSTTSFSFFIAPMLAGTRSGLLRRLAAKRIFQVDYRCEAYYWALAWEYALLQRGAAAGATKGRESKDWG